MLLVCGSLFVWFALGWPGIVLIRYARAPRQAPPIPAAAIVHPGARTELVAALRELPSKVGTFVILTCGVTLVSVAVAITIFLATRQV